MAVCGLFLIGHVVVSRTKPLPPAIGKPIRVLCTTGIAGDLVRNIAGSDVELDVVIRGDMDPHSYELVKGDDEKFSGADLVFASGLMLEHSASMQYVLKNHPNAVLLGNVILAEDPDEVIYVDGQLDPHIWMDPHLWKRCAPLAAQALSKVDPAHGEAFYERAKEYENRLEELDLEIRELFGKLPPHKKYLVTSHDAFNYFVRAYFCADDEKGKWDRRINALQGLAPDDQISPLDIKRIVDFIANNRVAAIFPETNLSTDSLNKVIETARKLGGSVKLSPIPIYGDTLGEAGSGAETYIQMVRHNAAVIYDALSEET
ncbi:MAG: hypothetical protein A3F09_05505 [Chlamydiae bacterium RIFCSPHIGHO2_12_FULL_49_11]|nr:MAG: hypothetical protein A3F09_05505 [Chlamydiae bacterium RIFCSPHIGHO2_12_FULL_49_11]